MDISPDPVVTARCTARWRVYFRGQSKLGKRRHGGATSNKNQIQATLQALQCTLDDLPVGVDDSVTARMHLRLSHLREDVHVILYEDHSIDERAKTTDRSTEQRLVRIVRMLIQDVNEFLGSLPVVAEVQDAGEISLLSRGHKVAVNGPASRLTYLLVSGRAIRCLHHRARAAMLLYKQYNCKRRVSSVSDNRRTRRRTEDVCR